MLGQGDKVTCIAFSPDGKTLASGGIDGTVKLRLAHRDWKVRATLKPPTRKTQDEFVLSLAFDPRGGWLAVGTGAGNVEMWDMATLKLRNKLHVHDVKNYGVLVALMPDGKTLATAAPNGLVQFWDAESLRNSQNPECVTQGVPDGVLAGRQVAGHGCGEGGGLEKTVPRVALERRYRSAHRRARRS